MITRQFRCQSCDKVAEFNSTSRPMHCSKPMTAGDVQFHGDNTTRRLHLIELLKTPEVDWQFADEPERTWEVWQNIRTHGRSGGERIGWVCQRPLFFEWKMPPGVKIQYGTELTMNQAVAAMLIAADGGIHAERRIQQVSGIIT